MGLSVLQSSQSVIKSIQRGITTLSNVTSQTVTISSVNTSKTIVNFLGFTNPGAGGTIGTEFANICLTNSTTLTVSLGGSQSTSISWEVIEYA